MRNLRRSDRRRQQRKNALQRPVRYSKLANTPAEKIRGYTKFTLDDVLIEDDEDADAGEKADADKDAAEEDAKDE